MCRARTGLVLLAVIAVPLPAQGEDRVRQSGRTIDQDGRPWPHADVTFLSRDLPWHESVGARDIVRARSDARGRFRAMLVRGRAYSSWAVGDGHASEVLEDLVARGTIRLREKARVPPVDIHLDGRRAWQPHGALQLFAVTKTENVWVEELRIRDDGSATLPALPGDWVHVEARVAGRPIWHWGVTPADREKRSLHLQMPKPYELLVALTDSRSGQPVAGARLLAEIRERWTVFGTTGKDGRAEIAWPLEANANGWTKDSYPVSLLVRAHGYGERIVQARVEPREHAGQDARAPDVIDKLVAAGGLRGRLLLTAGRPAVRHPLLVDVPLSRGRGWTIPKRPHVVLTSDDGGFEVVLPEIAHRGAAPRLRLLTVLGVQRAAGGPALLHTEQLSRGRTTGRDLGDVVLDELQQLDLRIVHADGRPASAAVVLVAEAVRAGVSRSQAIEYRSDRRGELRVLLPRGAFVLGAGRESALAFLDLDLPDGSGSRVIRLGGTVTITGRVVNAAAQPVAGAEVAWSPDARDVPTQLRGLITREPGGGTARTDSAGRFTLRVPNAGASCYVWAWVTTDGRRHSTRGSTPVRIDDDDPRIELVIPAAPGSGK